MVEWIIKNLTVLILLLSVAGCSMKSDIDKHINDRDNIVDVSDKICFIKTDLMVGPVAKVYNANDYIIVTAPNSIDNLIHIFDAEDYTLLCSRVKRGRGPHELTRMGDVAISTDKKKFYVPDFGKHKIFSYNVDSLLNKEHCLPIYVNDLPKTQFPSTLKAVDATQFIGTIIEPIGTGDFKQSIGIWDMDSSEISTIYSGHPGLNLCRVCYDYSPQHSIVAVAHYHHDLITLMDVDGGVKFNIYGPKWQPSGSNKEYHYEKIIISDNLIFASYSGGQNNSTGREIDQIIIYNLDGSYIKTLKIGVPFEDFCFNSKNNSLMFILNDENQFAYIKLADII